MLTNREWMSTARRHGRGRIGNRVLVVLGLGSEGIYGWVMEWVVGIGFSMSVDYGRWREIPKGTRGWVYELNEMSLGNDRVVVSMYVE